MLPYTHAKMIVQAEGIRSREEYQDFASSAELAGSFPEAPASFYAEWQSWGEFLGVFDAEEFSQGYKAQLMQELLKKGLESFKKTKRGAGFSI